MKFLSELKRRNVYRVAALYVIVGWVALQVVDVFSSFMPLPEWTGRLVFVLLAAGFPISLVLAWAIELTPEGMRLEQPAGGVAMSRSRRDALLLGGVIVVLFVAGWGLLGGRSDPAEGTIRSLVVLPLDNLMEDEGQAYLVEGMHEALIAELATIEGLRVISRTSAMKYRDANRTVPEIGEELGVDAVIEGSVLRSGETVRVTAQLIESASDRSIWAANFDREMTDILSLYADVTRAIAREIRSSTGSTGSVGPPEAPTVDPEAYDLYLRGSSLCQKWGPEQMTRGIEVMRRAATLAPDDARTQASLALCLQYAAFFGYAEPTGVLDEAVAAADRAVELDRGLADAWVAFAGVRYYLNYDFAASELALERALAINPNHVPALIHHSWQLGESGRTAAAVAQGRRAVELDPLTPTTLATVGQAHFLGHDFEAAQDVFERAVELDPNDPSFRFYLAWALEEIGDYDAALAAHEVALELSGRASVYLSGYGHALAQAGRTEEARQTRDELLALAAEGAADPFQVAIVELGLGNHDDAIEWLERAYDARISYMLYIYRGPQFEPLRGDERFEALVRRMGW